MKKTIILILFSLSSFIIDAQEIISPNGKIKVVLNLPDKNSSHNLFFKALYKIENRFIEVLPDSKLGINRTDEQFTNTLHFIKESKPVSIHDKYKMICGKRQLCENFGTEKVFSFQNSNQQPLNIVFRVYNDGIAFRYEFPNHSDSLKNISDEETTYVLPDSSTRWMQPFEKSYENFYPLSTKDVDEHNKQEWGYPALFKVNKQSIWGLISEAGISETNCAARLNSLQGKNKYRIVYPSTGKIGLQTGVMATLPWASQWHIIVLGSLSRIVESTLITDVSKPNTLKETSWIRPGAVSWIYWANNHGSKDYRKVVEYVDLAKEMNWPYVLIDWEWDVMDNGGDITDAVSYAKSRGIKPMIWYNSGTSWLDPTPNDRLLTAEKRTKEFAWLNTIGVCGIKVDFFAGDQQEMMQFYLDILKDAARYQLIVNFHGATLPRGWARTYPNLMTMEAVYGAEWYNNGPEMTNKAAAHNTTLPFTRNVVGSMDYTPVTFSNSQNPHITSYAHELALSVVFESGLQHFADKPSAYQSLPKEPKHFLQSFPTAWSDTKLIDGYPGEKIIIARRHKSDWYIGGLNGEMTPQNMVLHFSFLKAGVYELQLIKDGKDDKSFSSEKIKVVNGDTVNVNCLARGGFVGVIKRIK